MREVVWVGSTQQDVRAFPKEVRRAIGTALMAAQQGTIFTNTKPLKGFKGASVLEVVADHDTDTYRAVYTVKLTTGVFVLHAFQKKSAHGRATPQRHIELIARRLAEAQRLDAERAARQ